jgi:hypothetical protein
MSWYRCSCGFVAELTPRFGNTIVSVTHLHRAAHVDGSSVPERMVEIADVLPVGEIPSGPRRGLPAVALGGEAALPDRFARASALDLPT